ncbi:MAG: 30S ribosomal protein S1, partial [bacterium]
MVDVEKNLNNNLSGSEDPTKNNKGGDTTKEYTDINKEESTVSTPKNSFPPEQEYSEEEYNKFVDLYEQTLSDIKVDEIVTGRVQAITKNYVLVDIGFKSEGAIPVEEFDDVSKINVSDEIEVFIESLEDSEGQLVLSRKKANFVRKWEEIVKYYKSGETIKGVCKRRIKGGIVIDLQGVEAFLPGSQIDVKPIRDFDSLIGKEFDFKIVKINRLRRNIVVSRRVILEESRAEQREQIVQNIQRGDVYKGTVKNITDFGVFIDLGGVDGLLHINDLSWGRINHPSEVVSLDDEIEVMILDYNDAKDRISLGLKQLQSHPWEGIEEKYPIDSTVEGKIVSIADYGAFVELEKGVEGLIHISEMTWNRYNTHPAKIVNLGEVVKVKILSIEKEKKRISLGLKQLTPDPWEDIEKKYPIGSKHKGHIMNMTNFGVFVELEEGIDGLIHISDLSWTKKVRHPSEVLKKGEDVEVVILEINKSERRISLGYKQLSEDPWKKFENTYKINSKVTGKILRFIEKGLIVELPYKLEGFVPISQMQETSIGKVKKSHKAGDKIDLLVIEFEKNNKRVILSKKKLEDQQKLKESKDDEKKIQDYMKKSEDSKATLAEIADKTPEEALKDKKTKTTKKPSKKKSKEETKKD